MKKLFKTYFYNWGKVEKDTWIPYLFQGLILLLFLNAVVSTIASYYVPDIDTQFFNIFFWGISVYIEYVTNKRTISREFEGA